MTSFFCTSQQRGITRTCNTNGSSRVFNISDDFLRSHQIAVEHHTHLQHQQQHRQRSSVDATVT
jgi:hypothetical protein